MKKLLTAALFVLSGYGVSAQSNAVELSSHWDNQGNAVIEVSQHDGNIYTLIVDVYNAENLSVNRFARMRVKSRGTILTMKPINPDKTSGFGYSYKYIDGSINPRKVDSTFVYRLPYALSESREPRVLDISERSREGGDSSLANNWRSFQFTMNRGDTVYAARKGEVLKVVDDSDPQDGSLANIIVSKQINEILIEHADGTIASYNVLEKESAMVKPGDVVFPDTPIALAGSLDGEIYQVMFGIYYQTDNLSGISTLSDHKLTYHYINPVFATTAGEVTLKTEQLYKPVCTEEMITREMTKRELKQHTSR
jgi:hypothetical protein